MRTRIACGQTRVANLTGRAALPAFAPLPPSREALRRDLDEARRAESGRRGAPERVGGMAAPAAGSAGLTACATSEAATSERISFHVSVIAFHPGYDKRCRGSSDHEPVIRIVWRPRPSAYATSIDSSPIFRMRYRPRTSWPSATACGGPLPSVHVTSFGPPAGLPM